MIVLCYGITKSGSTLAFELAKALLEADGFVQRRLSDDCVLPGHAVNFLIEPTVAQLEQLRMSVAPHERIAIKLHGDLPPLSASYLTAARADFRVLVSYRDLREVVLSLLDAAARDRTESPDATQGFGAVIQSFEEATRFAGAQLENCRRWAAVPGALPLLYDEVAFGGNEILVQMAAHLSLPPPAPNTLARLRERVSSQAFTQRNKAVPGRYRELGAAREALLMQAVPSAAAFIERACRQRDHGWLTQGPISP